MDPSTDFGGQLSRLSQWHDVELPPSAAYSDLLTKHLQQEKNQEWASLAGKKEPLKLLHLPIDILQAILKEVTHTNDLTSLALTHPSLHDLVIPHIYSRFDIVWPDANTTVESRIGVDALTYGLATLVMGHDVFGEAPYQQRQSRVCEQCGNTILCKHSPVNSVSRRKSRRGNHFAQYTKKFSLGNGPADWVQEYLITKEGGKMLGTLVALAVGRMRNLEAFIWDMPTGVLRDVWLALASLGDRDDGQDCRLEKVCVRWHDNQEQSPMASPSAPALPSAGQIPNLPSLLAGPASSLFQIPPYPRVEFPTFSILPPLKSLSVLDIDELPYAEEMSILVERSLHRMRDLRIGVAQHAQFDIWARPAEDRSLVPPLPMPHGGQVARPGGLLGIVFGQFCDDFNMTDTTGSANSMATVMDDRQQQGMEMLKDDEVFREDDAEQHISTSEISQLGVLLSAQSIEDGLPTEVPPLTITKRTVFTRDEVHQKNELSMTNQFTDSSRDAERRRKLQLTTLEVERVYLSVAVLSRAIDWSRLTTLTLLDCRNHEQLWKALRKRFTPVSRIRTSSSSIKSPPGMFAGMFSRGAPATPKQTIPSGDYTLKITRLHTDAVSPALIAFLRDTLAPDSLEWLFLQECTGYKSAVTIDMIYKCVIRRHRGGLRKLLIDSGLRTDDETPDTNWRRWLYNRELLSCITSGKMKLRELSMSIDYKDWHFFLQRLPNATTLRSLHISHIDTGRLEAREAALQVLDIVALRPELEVCYLAIQATCFEVIEYTGARKNASSSRSLSPMGMHGQGHNIPDDEDEDDIDPDQDENDDENDFGALTSNGDLSDEEETAAAAKPNFRLREILFYDDKVSIFKARHGRL